MRRLLAWLAGAAGGLAAYRVLVRRRPAPEPVAVEADTRADELREKLAHARETASEEAGPDDPDSRRRSVHEHGRAAIDEMRRD
jgi:hypothetical protein